MPSPNPLSALASFLEHEADPMIILDTDYNVMAANEAYQRHYGADGSTYLGHKCYRVSHHYDLPCDQAGEHCPMRRAHDTKRPDRVLHIHHTPRGPEHVDVELRPILNAQHQVIAYVERIRTVRQASARAEDAGLVGRSSVFTHALELVQRVAPTMLPVLFLGESGTGKELFASALHETSARADGPFVVVDCSGVADPLFESELFGYEKGAFTGAAQRKLGLVETAQKGTLFLDEVGDIPLSMQVKLLRLIETGTFRRVGGLETLTADFRLVAATHKSLAAMVADGSFRQDLYYRINAFPIRLPPLRDRLDDLPMLIESLLRRTSKDRGRRVTLTSGALGLMQRYSWPGNIRELRNALERARLFTEDAVIGPEHLGDTVDGPILKPTAPPPLPVTGRASFRTRKF